MDPKVKILHFMSRLECLSLPLLGPGCLSLQHAIWLGYEWREQLIEPNGL